MNPQPDYVKTHTRLFELASILMQEKSDALPIVDEDMHLVGQVSYSDIIQAYLDDMIPAVA